MNSEVIELRNKALMCLGEIKISDGEAEIARLLLDLSETDEHDLELKEQILKTICDYLSNKSILNTNLTFLDQLTLSLKTKIDVNLEQLCKSDSNILNILIEKIKRNH